PPERPGDEALPLVQERAAQGDAARGPPTSGASDRRRPPVSEVHAASLRALHVLQLVERACDLRRPRRGGRPMKAQQLNGRRAAVYSVRLTPEQFQYIERAATLESEQAKGREPKGFSEFVRDAA